MAEPHDQQGHGIRRQEFLRNHETQAGQVRSDLWREGLADFNEIDLEGEVLWVPIGPAPLVVSPASGSTGEELILYQGRGPNSGEVTDIAIDPTGANDKIIYVATNDGGIWKTTDGGTTWVPTMDDMPSLSMGTVAIDPSNSQVVYAGTGNFYDGGNAFTKGVGIYRSSDGGSTWRIIDGGMAVTIFAGLSITKIVILSPNILLVATNAGLFRSVDAGQNFGANSPKFNDRQPVLAELITCLLQDASRPSSVIYACVYGRGIMKSVDAGITFFQNLFTAGNGAPTLPFGNLELAQSEANSQFLIASVQIPSSGSGSSQYKGLYRSLDGGSHWALLSDMSVAEDDGFGQTDYDLTLGIDPQNDQLVYVGFQELWRSRNGGSDFDPAACTVKQVHWDHHVLIFSPPPHRHSSPTAIYVGTDGGIAKSEDGGSTWTSLNGNIGSNLFRGIDIGRGQENRLYTFGGCQDTGTSGHRSGDSNTDWHTGIDGDGCFVAVDPTDPRTVYGFDDSDFIKSTDGGATWQATYDEPRTIGLNLPTPSTDFTRVIALDQTGTDPTKRIVYVGVLNKLYKSLDAGTAFGQSIFDAAENIDITALSTAGPERIWLGLSDASVHFSENAGSSWDATGFQPITGGAGPVTGIAVDPTNVSRVAVVFAGLSGIHSKYRTLRIFLTEDAGSTWNDISGTDGMGPLGNLPDLPMHSVAFDGASFPSGIVVASDGGVMHCTHLSIRNEQVAANWKIFGVGLPTVCCTSLAMDNTVQPPLLRVGTYGRSCFEAVRPQAPVVNVSAVGASEVGRVGSARRLPVYISNPGNAAFSIVRFSRTEGDEVFSVDPSLSFPLLIAAGTSRTFDVLFSPREPGDYHASFAVAIDDGKPAHSFSVSGTGVGEPFSPRLATDPRDQAGFGRASGQREVPLRLFNVGTADLQVSAIDRVDGAAEFTIDPGTAFPITIAPGSERSVMVRFQPSSGDYKTAVFRIASSDPHSPTNVTFSGTGAD